MSKQAISYTLTIILYIDFFVPEMIPKFSVRFHATSVSFKGKQAAPIQKLTLWNLFLLTQSICSLICKLCWDIRILLLILFSLIDSSLLRSFYFYLTSFGFNIQCWLNARKMLKSLYVLLTYINYFSVFFFLLFFLLFFFVCFFCSQHSWSIRWLYIGQCFFWHFQIWLRVGGINYSWSYSCWNHVRKCRNISEE